MKKLLSTAMAVLLSLNVLWAGKPVPRVDPRMELVSLVAKIARLPGFTKNSVPAYNNMIGEHLKDFTYHPVVTTAKKMYEEHNFQYDAIFNLAVHLVIEDDSVRIDKRFPATFEEDTRIGNPLTEQFVAELNDFYRQWDMARFFRENEEFYALFGEFMVENVTEKIHYDWFGDFFGTKGDSIEIVITLLTGTNNYGANTIDAEGRQTIYASICNFLGQDGIPRINIPYAISTIVHEIAHSFCNPLMDEYMDALEPYVQPIYNKMGDALREEPYDAKEAVLYEAFVRTVELVYARRFNPENYALIQNKEESKGFLGLEDFAELLRTYEANRDRYETMRQFMPEIVRFYREWAE